MKTPVRILSCIFALVTLLAATTPFAHADDIGTVAHAEVHADVHETRGHDHSGRRDIAETLHCGAHLLALNEVTPEFAPRGDRLPTLPTARQPAGTILSFDPPPPRS